MSKPIELVRVEQINRPLRTFETENEKTAGVALYHLLKTFSGGADAELADKAAEQGCRTDTAQNLQSRVRDP
jgi:hypothetical protein